MSVTINRSAPDLDAIDSINLNDDFDAPLDLSNVNENAGFSVLPPGTYNATVDSCEFAISRSSNNPMWTWIFKVHTDEGKTKTLFYHTVFTEGGLPRLKKALMQVAPDIDLSQLRPKSDCYTMVGRSCRVKVKVTNKDGQQRNEIQDVLAPAEASAMSFLS